MIETVDEAEELAEDIADRLRPFLPGIAATLGRCQEDSPCGLPICSVCSRFFRAKFIAQVMALARSHVGPYRFVTLFLRDFESGQLCSCDLRRDQTAVRRRFDRLGFRGFTIVGGTEVIWRSQNQTWLLHLHLLAIGLDDTDVGSLRRSWPSQGPRFPVQAVPCAVDENLVSYLQKFSTYQRIGRQAVPLPVERLVELARWSSRYKHADFPFIYGARREGRRLRALGGEDE
jgi:hypothetical protein